MDGLKQPHQRGGDEGSGDPYSPYLMMPPPPTTLAYNASSGKRP